MLPATIRAQFPALVGATETYLDSASTTQKPARVIDTIRRYHAEKTANAGRGTYPWATNTTRELARVRERFADFIGAAAPNEVVFTGGATAALNAVALAWGLHNLLDGDEILYSPRDHASNVYPWRHIQRILARLGVNIVLVPYGLTALGAADPADILDRVTPRTRLITVSHLHHTYGVPSTLAELHGRLDPSALLCFDCSQSGGHIPVDVQALRADFAVFAGHKMFGAPGSGVLYCRQRVHDALGPFLPGGNSADFDSGRMPALLEGGTPNIPGILALGSALEFIDDVGLDTIAGHNAELTVRLVAGLRQVPGLRFLSEPAPEIAHGIVSFRFDDITAADLGFALAAHGFLLRSGSHCIPGTTPDEESVRVSTHIYNTADEIDRFVDCLGALVGGGCHAGTL